MKRLPFLILLLSIFTVLSSCDARKKISNQTEQSMRGNWVLSQVSVSKDFSISQLLGQAPVNCFQGSEWHLVANNHSGYYTLNGMNCPSEQNKISWHMESDGNNTYLWFKRIDEGQKAKNVKSGYKMRVVSIDEYQAHFSQEVPVNGGGKAVVNYYFNKQ